MPDEKPARDYGNIQVTPYSATRWNPEDLTGAAEEIEITAREFHSLVAKRRQAKTDADGKPEWVDYTPDYVDIWQLAYLQNGLEIQDITLTVEEFNALKRHLAIMRGHIPSPRGKTGTLDSDE